MRSFRLRPAGTGSTSKSHLSSTASSATSSVTASITTSVSSSLSHAKLATSAAWSACKQGTQTTLKKGSSALHLTQSHQGQGQQSQPRAQQRRRNPHRVRRLFHLGKTNYRSLGDDTYINKHDDDDYDDDDERDIFSGRPFLENSGVQHHHQHQHQSKDGGSAGEEETEEIARFVYAPQHAASSYLATSTARHMAFEADDGEDEADDEEWWRE